MARLPYPEDEQDRRAVRGKAMLPCIRGSLQRTEEVAIGMLVVGPVGSLNAQCKVLD